jgi:hypothetical protein
MTIHRVRALLLTLALALSAPLAFAQGPLIAKGTRLRVTTVEHELVIGRSMTSSNESVLRIGTYAGVDDVRLDAVFLIEASQGRARLRTAARYGLRGAAIGFALLFLSPPEDPHELSGGEFAAAVGSWTLIGGAVGGTIGFLVGSETWIEVYPVDPRRR